MEDPKTLEEIPSLESALKSMPAKSSLLLHKLIFESDEGKKNRANLRKFDGFKFDENSRQYTEKIKYIKDNFTTLELGKIYTILGVDSTAESQDDLIEELMTYLMEINVLAKKLDDNKEDEEDEDTENESDIIKYGNSIDNVSELDSRSEVSEVNKNAMGCMASYKDIEDLIRTFDGKTSFTVERFLEEFEEHAKLLNMTDFQKFLFCKKSLRGLAKQFILSERNITTWPKLKRVLIDEFAHKISNADLHRTLMKRKMKNDKSLI